MMLFSRSHHSATRAQQWLSLSLSLFLFFSSREVMPRIRIFILPPLPPSSRLLFYFSLYSFSDNIGDIYGKTLNYLFYMTICGQSTEK